MKIDAGTEGYFPPELKLGPMPLNIERRAATTKANVWQVGETMLVAMMGISRHSRDGPEGRVYYTHEDRRHLIEIDQWSDYSDELIAIVEWCVKHDMENRPTPGELLEVIAACMHKHDDGMNRWGTLSWVMEKSRLLEGPFPNEDAEYEAGDYENGDGTSVTAGAKRKASGPHTMPPDAKRSKAETALRRRLVMVANDIKGHRPKCHADATAFRSRRELRMHYGKSDSMFDANTFFNTADPGPIEFLELDPTANKTKKVKTTEIDGVIYIDDDDDEAPKALPAPVTPAKPKKPVKAKGKKAAGTSANPILITPSPVKPKKALKYGDAKVDKDEREPPPSPLANKAKKAKKAAGISANAILMTFPLADKAKRPKEK